MTENGSFIVNGSERVIVSQLHRSPGVIFLEKSLPTGRTPTAQIIPYRGAWVEFEIDTKDQIYVRIDKRKKLPATVLLRALGWESDADILKLYAKTERLVLAGWQVTHAEGPAKQLKSGDLLDAADFRQASTDYPDLEVERCYRVTEVTDKNCPLEIGQELTYKDRTNLRRKWKGFETELFRRVVDTHNSGCELIPGQVLTNSEYEGARARYGSKAFTAEQILSQDSQESVGRVCAEDIINPETGEVLLTANTLLTETELERLGEAGVEALTVLDAEDCQHIRFLRNTLERDRQADYEEPYTLKDAALLTIFRTLRPGDPAGLENARKHLSWLLFDAHRYDLGVVGRYKLNRKFQNIPVYGEPPEETLRTLRPEDIAATVDYLLKVHNGIAPKDDLDHLGNRRVRVIGELLENQFRMGLFQIRRTTRERLSTDNDIAKVVPSSLVNPKPLMMALREFFGSNQLSQFMQQINPLDELTHKRRISAIGPGGLHRDRATAAVRDVHRTHYGRVCPLETPEGPSIGLIVSLACYGRINPYGFIETPYHRVDEDAKLGPVEYLTADTRATQRNGKQTGDGDAAASEHLLPVRSGEDVLSLPMEKVDYIGVSPQQIVGISAALVPFLEHEDANRALMGANHQRQAVPLVRPEAPLVGTGMEAPAALYSGALITAKRAGTVTSVSADEILIYTGETLHHDQELQTFKRSNSGTCIHQHPIVAVGDIVEAEQVIVDGTSTENGELALGRNVLCAYMPWGGHNYEDSILISETLIKEDTFTSIHIEEFEVEARETKVGPEEITRDIPNVSEQRLTQLDEEGIIRVGSVVGAGSILVGKITPKGESEYGPEEKLLRAIFGEKVKEVRDASTYVRPGVEGVVIDVKLEMGDELKPGVIKRVKVYVASKRPISVGDKMAGRYGNKGVIAKILPAEDMPYLPDGTPVELVLNPLGVPSRMNVGQILEIHLGWACHELGIRVATPVFDGATEGEIFEMLGKTDLPKRSKQSGKSILFDGRTGDPFAQEVTVGYVYFLKLNHLVADKMHARSTGPYSLVTQQPLGGKAQHGGQRLGEMEVWALEAYGAAHTLQEMLTLKSDDVLGRREIYESVVKGLNPEPPGTPESFKVLVRELQTLGLYVSLDKDEDCLLQPSSHSVIIFEVCFSNPPAPLLQATGFV
ncbi:DNA-directed RNA polymerase subunit beta [Geodia barretti]|uniref:DNA-directed RNA polymerase n=1 Tax=Geodia barretti TaxID=519541 RepID=A0AA35WDM6_GEOBA|nr:DNA-directed RNA polymerase subunit beta [Geodia barretti]